MSVIKLLNKEDYDAVFELSQFAFQYKLSKKEMEEKQAEAKRHTVWGYMDEDRIAAKLHLIPLTCFIGGKQFEMGGISSVATWPEYRRKGMVKQLLLHALHAMKQSGQTLSFLHPFSFSFYRKFGWEHVFNLKHYSIPMDKMKGSWSGKGYVRRSSLDIHTLNSIYTDYAKQFSGTLVRDEKWWNQRVFKAMGQLAIAYNESNEAEGYIHYQVKDNVLEVNELVYCNVNGLKLLLEFIANHDSMADTIKMNVPESDMLSELMNEPTFKQQIKPYFMARVVDVLSFLEKYPFNVVAPQESITIFVEDEFFPENEGVYELRHDGNGVAVTQMKSKGNNQEMIRCSIQQFTKMFIGYKRPIDLLELGFIEGSEAEVKRLETWIPQKQTYYTLSDFF